MGNLVGAILAIPIAFWGPGFLHAQDLNESLEKMIKQAAAKVAPAVVQIITQGGTDQVVTSPKGPVFRKAIGPTTGVIVAPDGYVISSAFNFVNNRRSSWSRCPAGPSLSSPNWWRPTKHACSLYLKSTPRDCPCPVLFPRRKSRRANGRSLWAAHWTPSATTLRRSAWASSAPRAASGARRSRPTPRSRRPTMAARSSTSRGGCRAS